jgi:RES domain-containing protein
VDSLPAVPASLPQPLAGEVLDLATTSVVRIHSAAGRHPLRWDQPRESLDPIARFDPHAAGPVGVWYAALRLETALAEAFQETCTVAGGPALPSMCIARLTATRLLDLGSRWATRATCGALITTAPHAQTQAWAAAIRASFPDLDGLVWPSSVDPAGQAIVLWTSPGGRPPLMKRPDLVRALADRAIARHIAAATQAIGYRYALPV